MHELIDLILNTLLYSVQLMHAKHNHSYNIEFNNYLESKRMMPL